MNEQLLLKLNTVCKIAGFSKIVRFLFNPFKYCHAIFFRLLVYPKSQNEKIVETELFYGKKIKIALPSSTDIYLTKGKSHSSEIRLAKFIIKNLKENEHFLDIGAHIGYFTMIASEIVGKNGKVFSFEPSTKTFSILFENTKNDYNIKTFQKAVSNEKGNISFFEFANLYSEYNSKNIDQFKNENWFEDNKPIETTVNATTIDSIFNEEGLLPNIIKIDVEGAENLVIEGGLFSFENHSPIIVMEYLSSKRKNETHKLAVELLRNINYITYLINDNGELISTNDIDNYFESNNIESDNIVFIKN